MLASYHDVDVVATSKAMIGDRQKAISVWGQVDANHLGLLATGTVWQTLGPILSKGGTTPAPPFVRLFVIVAGAVGIWFRSWLEPAFSGGIAFPDWIMKGHVATGLLGFAAAFSAVVLLAGADRTIGKSLTDRQNQAARIRRIALLDWFRGIRALEFHGLVFAQFPSGYLVSRVAGAHVDGRSAAIGGRHMAHLHGKSQLSSSGFSYVGRCGLRDYRSVASIVW